MGSSLTWTSINKTSHRKPHINYDIIKVGKIHKKTFSFFTPFITVLVGNGKSRLPDKVILNRLTKTQKISFRKTVLRHRLELVVITRF